MDIQLYRKYLLNWPLNYWDWDILKLSEKMSTHFYPDRYLNRNHPLVISGNAYWINRKTLCLGYKLEIDNDIFRPIFSHKRQIMIDEFLPNIKIAVYKREKNKKCLEIIRIKKLPTEVIHLIMSYL